MFRNEQIFPNCMSCFPITSFCFQVQIVSSFRNYFFPHHSHINCLLSSFPVKTCKMVMSVNICHDFMFFRQEKMLSQCLLCPDHKISTFSQKQMERNVNITTKSLLSFCMEPSSLQNLIISFSEVKASSRLRAPDWLCVYL